MANGQTSVSPTNEVIISIKVESGQKGERGLIGLTPQLTVTNTITGAPNTNASVTIAGTAENPGLTFTIPRGTPFDIAAKYASIADLVSNVDPIPAEYEPLLFDLAIIQSNVEDEDNARLYIYDNNDRVGKGGWTFVSDLSGATGPMRDLRWKPDNGGTTSILQWENEDGSYDETEARDLALQFEFTLVNDELILTIENADGITDTVNLTSTAEFGNGTNATLTSVKFTNNNNTTTSFQELGVYASFDGTELTITNPDTQEVVQELGLSFEWDDTELGVKTPTDQNFTYQKLSPDISFETNGGVSISVVEPDAAQNLVKISPDIDFQNIGNGVELSIVEPGAAQSFNKISPDIDWDGTQLAIVEPGVTPTSGDYVELGLISEFGAGSTTETTLTVTNPQSGSTPISQELGVYASWNNTELILTNPDNDTVEQELALDFNWDGTTLQIKNPTEISYDPSNEQKLSPDIAFDTSDGVSISVVEPGEPENFIKISPDIAFDTSDGVSISVVEPGTTLSFNKISPDIYFDGTSIAIMEPGVSPEPEDFVDLKGNTGNAAESGTSLFRIRDDNDTTNNGYLTTVSSEMKLTGTDGIKVERSSEVFTFSLPVIDGGEF